MCPTSASWSLVLSYCSGVAHAGGRGSLLGAVLCLVVVEVIDYGMIVTGVAPWDQDRVLLGSRC